MSDSRTPSSCAGTILKCRRPRLGEGGGVEGWRKETSEASFDVNPRGSFSCPKPPASKNGST